MGNCRHKQVGVLFVDDDPDSRLGTIGFAPVIFKGQEWEPFKAFCNKRYVSQGDLQIVFKRFLSHEEVYIREFRVRCLDARNAFLGHSKLMQEMADTFVPSIFCKEYRGLEKPYSNEEISFARFVLMSYIFCSQPMTDVIYDFLAILRHKLTIKLNAVMFSYNFEQILKVITEEHAPSASLRTILKICNRKDDQEISIEYLMRIGVKYPLVFYALAKFQKHFRRLVFGERFWKLRKPLKSRFGSLSGLRSNATFCFENEEAARKETARSLIADVMLYPNMPLELNVNIPRERMVTLSEECFFRLKEAVGYQLARGIILESELLLDRNIPLLQTPEPTNEEERMLDDKAGHEFVFNLSTGLKAWVQKFVDEDGEVLRENVFRQPPPEIFEKFKGIEDKIVTSM